MTRFPTDLEDEGGTQVVGNERIGEVLPIVPIINPEVNIPTSDLELGQQREADSTELRFLGPVGTVVKGVWVNQAAVDTMFLNIEGDWFVADGANGTINLGGKVIAGLDPGGAADYNAVGNMGGAEEHNHDDHTIANHTAADVGDHDAHVDHFHFILATGDQKTTYQHFHEIDGTWLYTNIPRDSIFQQDPAWNEHTAHNDLVHAAGGDAGLAHVNTDHRDEFYVLNFVQRVS